MFTYYSCIHIFILTQILTTIAAPIDDYNEHDPWYDIHTRQFFGSPKLKVKKNHNYYNAYEEYTKPPYSYAAQEIVGAVKDHSNSDLLSNRKTSISDFGTSYGYYPIGLAIFTDGIRSEYSFKRQT